MGALLAAFVIVEALHVPLLTDPGDDLGGGGVGTAALGVGLLVVDVALPVPSSVVMTVLGARFGVAVGAGLSLLGSVGAALLAYAIGLRGGPLLERLVSKRERERADRVLRRWGPMGVLVTRPVPLLAETVAMLAGASRVGAARVGLAALAGSLPGAVLYAIAGASLEGLASGPLVFGAVLALAALTALLGRLWRPG